MFRAYKYRIYPNSTQRKIIEQTFGACRLVYNIGLEIKRCTWNNIQKNISAFDLIHQLVDAKKDYLWLTELDSQALNASILKLDVAYKKFYNGAGYPKFKSKNDKQSFQCPNNTRKIDFEKRRLTIPKIANIRIECSRRFIGNIKTVTISKSKTGKYFASILVDTMTEVPKKASVEPESTIGMDMGIKELLILSNGKKFNNLKFLKNEMGRLKYLQKQASKKKKGGKNRKKANLRVAVQHEIIRNKRIDYLHKLTTGLVRDSQATTFCMENLAIINMMKNHSLAQAISDVSWSEIKRQMKYKCDWYGKNLIEIGRFEPSTKMCSECGQINEKLTLADREWTCTCGASHDRDINAAKNIRKIGLAKYSGRGTSGEPVELSSLAKRRNRNLGKANPLIRKKLGLIST